MKAGFVVGLVFLLIVPYFFAATTYKDNAMSLYFAGQNAYNQGNYEEAEKFLDQSLALDPSIEAKVSNIKFMLGVSAFKNQNYSMAKVNLSLFPENPIALDLLKKIEEIEANQDQSFYYFTQNQSVSTPAPLIATSATETVDAKNSAKPYSMGLVVALVFGSITALSVFLELRFGVFSRVAVKLIIVKSPIQVTITPSTSDTLPIPEAQSDQEESDILLLSDTPFEEKIDIQKMASSEIEEISRFFKQEAAGSVTQNADTTQPVSLSGISKEDMDRMAKNEILASTKVDSIFESEKTGNKDSEQNTFGRELNPTTFDDFNVQEVLKSADTLIQKALLVKEEKKSEDSDWKPLAEYTEGVQKDLEFFETSNEVGDTDLVKFFDLLFEKETETSKI